MNRFIIDRLCRWVVPLLDQAKDSNSIKHRKWMIDSNNFHLKNPTPMNFVKLSNFVTCLEINHPDQVPPPQLP